MTCRRCGRNGGRPDGDASGTVVGMGVWISGYSVRRGVEGYFCAKTGNILCAKERKNWLSW